MKAWINGEFKGWDEANVSLLSHSFGRGSAIFEVVDIVDTDSGPALFGLNEHIDRFYNSADLTFMDIPISKDKLKEAVIKTARENGVREGAAKFFAYYPIIEFSVLPTNPHVDIAVFCVDYDLFNVKQEELSAPVTVGISSFRKVHPDTVPVHAKVCGNYVNPFLAKMEAKKRGFDDVIMHDTRGFVAEGATSNIFFAKGNRVKTPPLINALPGITRRAVIEIVKDLGYGFEETDIREDELSEFDEGFYSGSVVKIQPILSIEGKALEICPGPVTTAVKEKLDDVMKDRDKRYRGWLTFIG